MAETILTGYAGLPEANRLLTEMIESGACEDSLIDGLRNTTLGVRVDIRDAAWFLRGEQSSEEWRIRLPGVVSDIYRPFAVQHPDGQYLWTFTHDNAVKERGQENQRVVRIPAERLLPAIPRGWGLMVDTGRAQATIAGRSLMNETPG